jgi:hypothetical protein
MEMNHPRSLQFLKTGERLNLQKFSHLLAKLRGALVVVATCYLATTMTVKMAYCIGTVLVVGPQNLQSHNLVK